MTTPKTHSALSGLAASFALITAPFAATPSVAQNKSNDGFTITIPIPEDDAPAAKPNPRVRTEPVKTAPTKPLPAPKVEQATPVTEEVASELPALTPAQIQNLRNQRLAYLRGQTQRLTGGKTSAAIGFYNSINTSATFMRTMDAIRFASAQKRLGCSVREMSAVIYLESNLGTLENTHEGDAAGMGQIREVTAANLARIYELDTIAPFQGKTYEWFAANRENPYVNALLTCAQINENRVLLDARGLGVNPAYIYMMHNMGSEVATNLIRNIRSLSALRGDAWYALSQKNAFDLVPESSATGNPGYLMTLGKPANIVNIAARYASASAAANNLGIQIEADSKAAGLTAPTLSFVNGRLVSSFDNVIAAQEAKERGVQTSPRKTKSGSSSIEDSMSAQLDKAFLYAGGGAALLLSLGLAVAAGRRLRSRHREQLLGQSTSNLIGPPPPKNP